MSNKRYSVVALLVMFALLLASCGTQPAATTAPAQESTTTEASAETSEVAEEVTEEVAEEAAAEEAEAAPEAAEEIVPEGVTTIKVVDWVGDNVTSWANRWYKPFEEANPDIKIVHEVISGNFVEAVLTRLTGSNDIDLIWVAPDTLGSFLRSGAALDLTPYIEADADMLRLDTFPQWTLDDYTSVRFPELELDGQYGLPIVMFVWQQWFNSDIMSEAGLTTPERGWTWDDFAAMANKMTDPSKHQYGYQNQNWSLPLYTWMWQNGSEIVTSEDGVQRLTIGEQPVVDAMMFLQNLQLNDQAFVPIDQTMGANPIGFDTGNAGIITRGNWNLDLSRDWTFAWDLSYPQQNVAEGTLGEELGMIINKNSPKADIAWRVLSWVASPEGQASLAASDIVPNTEVMKEIGLSTTPDNVRNVVVPMAGDPMVHSSPQWFRPKYTQGDLFDRLSLIWTGEASADELLPELQEEFNEALAQPLE